MKWLWLSVVVVILDQCSKLLADSMLALHESVPVIPFFSIRLAYNTGAAFSVLADADGWHRWFFVVLALAIIVLLVNWLRRLEPGDRLNAVALALVLGGAVGNLIDR
ncbi:MAG TPA: signal peptidase II, partial [Pseudomonadales bacterium]